MKAKISRESQRLLDSVKAELQTILQNLKSEKYRSNHRHQRGIQNKRSTC